MTHVVNEMVSLVGHQEVDGYVADVVLSDVTNVVNEIVHVVGQNKDLDTVEQVIDENLPLFTSMRKNPTDDKDRNYNTRNIGTSTRDLTDLVEDIIDVVEENEGKDIIILPDKDTVIEYISDSPILRPPLEKNQNVKRDHIYNSRITTDLTVDFTKGINKIIDLVDKNRNNEILLQHVDTVIKHICENPTLSPFLENNLIVENYKVDNARTITDVFDVVSNMINLVTENTNKEGILI